MLKAISSGFASSAIAQSSYQRQLEIESGKVPIVGVNILNGGESEREPKILRVHPRLEASSIRALRAWRKQRSMVKVKNAMAAISAAVAGPDNVIPPTIEAVESGATLGEIAQAVAQIAHWHKLS